MFIMGISCLLLAWNLHEAQKMREGKSKIDRVY